MRWEHLAGIGTISVALVLSGCANDAATDKQSPTTTGSDATAATSASVAAPAGGAGVAVAQVQQALQTAAQAVPNGRAFDAELETHQGRSVFDVKVASGANEIKVVVDTDGKQVISQSQASTPSDDVAKVQRAQIDASRALQAAADHQPHTTFTEMEIDTNRDGVVVWQIELRRADGAEVEVEVDAQNGSVLPSR